MYNAVCLFRSFEGFWWPIPRHSLFTRTLFKSKEIHGTGFNEFKVHTEKINVCKKKKSFFCLCLIYKRSVLLSIFCVLLISKCELPKMSFFYSVRREQEQLAYSKRPSDGTVHESVNKILTIH